MKRFLAIVSFFLLSCQSAEYKYPRVEIRTAAGDIEVELYIDQAPVSTNAFLSYIDSGFYKNTSFYRVLNVDNQPSNAPKAELIQGGLYRTKNKRHINPAGLPHETTAKTGLRHVNGTISLARREPGSASTEYFICIGEQPGFDFGGENNVDGQGYAAFGKVVKGMEVVRKIYNRREDGQYFDPPVPVYNIVRL